MCAAILNHAATSSAFRQEEKNNKSKKEKEKEKEKKLTVKPIRKTQVREL